MATFLNSFAFAAKRNGIDILCVQPGMVIDTDFYLGTIPNQSVLRILRVMSQVPLQVVDTIWMCVGRPLTVVVDTGLFAYISTVIQRCFGTNVVLHIMSVIVRLGFFRDMNLDG